MKFTKKIIIISIIVMLLSPTPKVSIEKHAFNTTLHADKNDKSTEYEDIEDESSAKPKSIRLIKLI